MIVGLESIKPQSQNLARIVKEKDAFYDIIIMQLLQNKNGGKVMGDFPMKEFDNIKIEQLTEILNTNTTLERYYSLLSVREDLIGCLLDLDIVDKYMFFDAFNHSTQELAERTGIAIKVLNEFERFLHLHDYINRRLSEIKSVNQVCIEKLKEKDIKYSKDYLQLCLGQDMKAISSEYGIAAEDAEHLFALCDLMRLPGVKDVRASLYYDCGYKSLQIFSEQNEADMRQHIADCIAKMNLRKSVPFSKELRTQIAVAKILPKLVIGGKSQK